MNDGSVMLNSIYKKWIQRTRLQTRFLVHRHIASAIRYMVVLSYFISTAKEYFSFYVHIGRRTELMRVEVCNAITGCRRCHIAAVHFVLIASGYNFGVSESIVRFLTKFMCICGRELKKLCCLLYLNLYRAMLKHSSAL